MLRVRRGQAGYQFKAVEEKLMHCAGVVLDFLRSEELGGVILFGLRMTVCYPYIFYR